MESQFLAQIFSCSDKKSDGSNKASYTSPYYYKLHVPITVLSSTWVTVTGENGCVELVECTLGLGEIRLVDLNFKIKTSPLVVYLTEA